MTTVAAGPYEAKIPRNDLPRPNWQTAAEDLADALEGQGPHLAKVIASEIGPKQTAALAQVVRRAVAVGIKRRADQDTADRLTGLQDLLMEGLDQVTDGCTTPEVETDGQ